MGPKENLRKFMDTGLLAPVWLDKSIRIAPNTQDMLNGSLAPTWPGLGRGWGRRLGWSGSQAGLPFSIQNLFWLTDKDKDNAQIYEYLGESC